MGPLSFFCSRNLQCTLWRNNNLKTEDLCMFRKRKWHCTDIQEFVFEDAVEYLSMSGIRFHISREKKREENWGSGPKEVKYREFAIFASDKDYERFNRYINKLACAYLGYE